MINVFNSNYILIHYVYQVIFNCYTISSGDEIVTKEILLSEKRSFNFALFTCGINILFFHIFRDFHGFVYYTIHKQLIYPMMVSLDQCRAVIGNFNCGSLFAINSHSISLTRIFTCFLLVCILPKCLYISLLTLLYIFSFFLCNGDIEPNPGPRKLKQNSLSICHWNLNSLSAQNSRN